MDYTLDADGKGGCDRVLNAMKTLKGEEELNGSTRDRRRHYLRQVKGVMLLFGGPGSLLSNEKAAARHAIDRDAKSQMLQDVYAPYLIDQVMLRGGGEAGSSAAEVRAPSKETVGSQDLLDAGDGPPVLEEWLATAHADREAVEARTAPR